MLIKLESKSEGVKGLSFHSERSWILASLESGVIQLWDYRFATLIEQFQHHHGPVRGVHFHKSHPLFVSGGDDHEIKVWNYRMPSSWLFSLVGHLDKIRSVEFHDQNPWIVSGSDDESIRIWNWESRECICILSGHTHSVMSASFFYLYEDEKEKTKEETLILSASLDKTVRVWRWNPYLDRKTCEFVLKGHRYGVNWAAFYAGFRFSYIVSASDDQIKRWQLGLQPSKVYEFDPLRGHMSSVSCVLFHPSNMDIILSCSSEDRSIIVWSADSVTIRETFSREHDNRFSILASHPKANHFAAAHDSGMIVFKLERERPVFSVTANSVYNLQTNDQDWFLRVCELSSSKDTEIRSIPIKRCCSCPPSSNPPAKLLSYSSSENAALICLDVDGGSYELYMERSTSSKMQEAGKGSGGWALFMSGNRFAVLDNRTNHVLVKNLKNETEDKIPLPVVTDAIFYAGTRNLLCRAEDRVYIFDLQRRVILGELQTCFVKYVVWSNDMESVALLSKQSIVIANNTLVHHCTLRETLRVKSGAWDDDNGVFIYTTLNHIKYCLPNGDSGIIKTLDNTPLYITKVSGNKIRCLDRDGCVNDFVIDAMEYVLKSSLLKGRYDSVKSMIRRSEICGHAMIAYLQQKGFLKLALLLAKNGNTRCNLALKSGDIQIAFASAKEIDEKDQWYRLGVEALRQGNASIVEYAYQRTKNFKRLSFLYLITGNLDKLSKILKIAEANNGVMGQFHNACYLGDIRERVKILENAGNKQLAYVAAAVHGLHETAECLAAELGDKVPCLLSGKSPSLLVPPRPIICSGNWPLLRVERHN